MNRRELLAAGIGGALGVQALAWGRDGDAAVGETGLGEPIRKLFPRLGEVAFLNAAAGTPLGTFAAAGLERYEEYWRFGPGGERWDDVGGMLLEVRELFGRLIGARPSELALVHCTKAGEQIVLDGLPRLREGANLVTNEMHFSGSLHNLVGLRRAGLDVRIVRGRDFDVPLEAMEAAIDDKTALVSVTLVSNVNGRFEPMRELAEIAHARGAHVYADVIQAAGIVPFDVRSLGIDFAACSGYKWLLGPHGVGFLFVRQELQGSVLEDRMFPGHVRFNYPPWVDEADPAAGDFVYEPPADAQRYQPGHISYLGYCALLEGLKLIDSIGVEAARRHSVRLIRRLLDRLDPERYPSISPDVDRSPIVAFKVRDAAKLEERLRSAPVSVTLAGNRLRVSPAIYNHEGDVDLLAEVLNRG